MKTPDLGALTRALAKNRWALLVLIVGLALLALPRHAAADALTAAAPTPSPAGAPMAASGIPLDTECARLAELLSAVRGVGKTCVLLSDRGCVVVCEGADSADVRLDVTDAVAAYTGLGSDRIRILKMEITGGNAK